MTGIPLYNGHHVISQLNRLHVPIEGKRYPRNHWKSISNQRKFLDELAKKLNITNINGWYTITKTVLLRHGAGGLLDVRYNNSPSKLLTTVYPEYPLLKFSIYLLH